MTTIVAKVVLLNADDKVLLLRRSATDTRRPGEWDFPGGGVDEGESYAAAAARELFEEAGITMPVEKLVLLYTATEYFDSSSTNVCRLLYGIRLTGPDDVVRLSNEHDDYKWVDQSQALIDFPHPVYGVGLQYAMTHNLLP